MQHIERNFDRKLVTSAVFLDLTASYGTVWHLGLRLKLQRTLSSEKMTSFIVELLTNRSFVLFNDKGEGSKLYRLKNGVAEGSILAPTLYNLYTADLPDTLSSKYIFADDVALAAACPSFREVEEVLTEDMEKTSKYMQKWRLKISTNKTVTSIFYLRNRNAGLEIKVKTPNGDTLPFEPHPKYLGVTLDRSLTFLKHCLGVKQKVFTRVALLRRLVSTKWGASFRTIRTSALAPAYAPAEYCAPTWSRSAHARQIDVPLDKAPSRVLLSDYFLTSWEFWLQVPAMMTLVYTWPGKPSTWTTCCMTSYTWTQRRKD